LAHGVFDTLGGQPVDKSRDCQYPDVTPTGSDVTPRRRVWRRVT